MFVCGDFLVWRQSALHCPTPHDSSSDVAMSGSNREWHGGKSEVRDEGVGAKLCNIIQFQGSARGGEFVQIELWAYGICVVSKRVCRP